MGKRYTEISGSLFATQLPETFQTQADEPVVNQYTVEHEEISPETVEAALARRFDCNESQVAGRLIALPTLERGRIEFGYWGTEPGKKFMLSDSAQIRAQLIHNENTNSGLSSSQRGAVARLDRETYSGPGDTDTPPVMYGGRSVAQRKYTHK